MRDEPTNQTPPRLPKLCGADIELGNFVLGSGRPGSTGYEASRAVLRKVRGVTRAPSLHSNHWSVAGQDRGKPHGCGFADSSCGNDGASRYYDAQDWGRKFLASNGGCVYIDLDHLELCLPEVTSAWDHMAAWHAMLRIARGALEAANREQPPGQQIQVLVNNSDGQDNSYGSHLNLLVTRQAWRNIFERKMHYLLFLAAYQVSSIVLTGQGKVGAENGAPPAGYQISQRADFFETLVGSQTTFHRPVVNSRDEALCGSGRNELEDAARLHVIFYDNTLAHTACLLKIGLLQILGAMLEAGCVNPVLVLDDPLEALVAYSHDPTLQARAKMASGAKLTAVELQMLFLEEATRFVGGGGCEGIVPRAPEILALWEDTLVKLRAQDLDSLAARLDWVLKLRILLRAMDRQPELGWDSPQVKHLDLLYSSLDPAEGLYWAYENGGLVERVASEAEIERFLVCPPEDTRAWGRAMLLRRASPSEIDDVDWDCLRFRIRGRDYWSHYRTLDLANPLAFTRVEMEPILDAANDLEETLNVLESKPPAEACEAVVPACQRLLPGESGGKVVL